MAAMLWKDMTIDEYAQNQQVNGINTLKIDDVWWAEVKPCFYRPLLPWIEIKPGSVKYPVKSIIGGVQHAVPAESSGNSRFNLFFLDDLQNYSLDRVCKKRRYKIKKGMSNFTINEITDCKDFKQQVYDIYVDFYHRTRYGYKKERLQKVQFNAWADSLFLNPKLLILGAWFQNKLCAINTSLKVKDVIIGASYFATTQSLSMCVSDYFMHFIHAAAAKSNASRIFYGWATGERGLDDFKKSIGCSLVQLPAWYHINPAIMLLTKLSKKYNMNKLIGDL